MQENLIYIENPQFINDNIANNVEYLMACFNKNIEKCHPRKITKEAYKNIADDGTLNTSLETCHENNELIVLAIGKSAHTMIDGITDYYRDDKCLTVVASSPNIHRTIKKYGNKYYLYSGGHPHITESSLEAGEKTIQIARNSGTKHLIICLISGGGSAAFESLHSIFSIEDSLIMSSVMLNLGMEDHEINVFRKVMSRIKGGKLFNPKIDWFKNLLNDIGQTN